MSRTRTGSAATGAAGNRRVVGHQPLTSPIIRSASQSSTTGRAGRSRLRQSDEEELNEDIFDLQTSARAGVSGESSSSRVRSSSSRSKSKEQPAAASATPTSIGRSFFPDDSPELTPSSIEVVDPSPPASKSTKRRAREAQPKPAAAASRKKKPSAKVVESDDDAANEDDEEFSLTPVATSSLSRLGNNNGGNGTRKVMRQIVEHVQTAQQREQATSNEVRELKQQLTQAQKQIKSQQKQITVYAKKSNAQLNTIEEMKMELEVANEQVNDLQRLLASTEAKYQDALNHTNEATKTHANLTRQLRQRESQLQKLQESYQNLENDFVETQEVMKQREEAIKEEKQTMQQQFEQEQWKLDQARKEFERLQRAGRAELEVERASLVHEQRRLELKRERWQKTWKEHLSATIAHEVGAPPPISVASVARKSGSGRKSKSTDMDVDEEAEEAKEMVDETETTPTKRRRRSSSRAKHSTLDGIGGASAAATTHVPSSPLSVGSLASSGHRRTNLPASSLERLATPPHSRSVTPERKSTATMTPVTASTSQKRVRLQRSSAAKKVANQEDEPMLEDGEEKKEVELIDMVQVDTTTVIVPPPSTGKVMARHTIQRAGASLTSPSTDHTIAAAATASTVTTADDSSSTKKNLARRSSKRTRAAREAEEATLDEKDTPVPAESTLSPPLTTVTTRRSPKTPIASTTPVGASHATIRSPVITSADAKTAATGVTASKRSPRLIAPLTSASPPAAAATSSIPSRSPIPTDGDAIDGAAAAADPSLIRSIKRRKKDQTRL